MYRTRVQYYKGRLLGEEASDLNLNEYSLQSFINEDEWFANIPTMFV